jgi:uncharacterized repeat protein (TIGR01451 family)
MSSRKHFKVMAALLAFAALALAVPLAAQAAGTTSGTQIGNTATIIYSVGGVTQPQVSSGPTATFTVDNKVNLTVAASTANVSVIPGSTDRVLVFSVTNNGNTTQAYGLSVYSRGTDSFDMSSIRVYRDVNNNGTLEIGTDTLYVDPTTFGNLVSDATFTVLVVADTPAPLANAETAVQDLVATTYDTGGLVVTAQTTTATAGVDVVFADIPGTWTNDINRDGEHSAVGTYTVSAAGIAVTKSTAIYSDPFNGTTEPKAIPGAVITYTVTVSNAAGGSQATNVTITDIMPANVTFKPQYDDGTGLGCSGTQGIVVDDDGPGANPRVCKENAGPPGNTDGADYNVTTGSAVTANGLTISAGASATVQFQVTIN